MSFKLEKGSIRFFFQIYFIELVTETLSILLFLISEDVWTLLGAQKRFLEIGRQQNQNKGATCNDKGDYPIDFSHERGSFFPPHTGSNDRSSAQENSYPHGILSQSNQSKPYQPNSFLQSSFNQFVNDSRPPFFQGGFNQGIPGTDSFPQPTFMPGLDVSANKDSYHNVPTTMNPQSSIAMSSQGSADKTNGGISQSEADLIKEMLTSTPVQDVINSAMKPEKDKSKSKSDTEKDKEGKAKKKRERRPETWQRNIKKKLKTEGKEYVNAKGKLVPAKKMLPIDCSKCKQKCTEKISEETRKKIFEWFWKLGSYTAQKEFVVSRVTQVATKTSKRRHVHRLFSFEINGKYESVCKPFFSRTLGIGDSYIYKAFEQKARDLFVHDGRGKHSPANKTSQEQVAFMHEHLDKYLTEFDLDKPLPKNIHAQKWYDEYMASCSEKEQKPVSKHIYRKIFQEYVRKFPPSTEKKKSSSDSESSSMRPLEQPVRTGLHAGHSHGYMPT